MSDNKYTVIISEQAMSMLQDHVRFLAQVSITAAQKLRTEIIDEMRELSYMPESYPWLKAVYLPFNKYRKKLVAKRYLLIYQIVGNVVFIDYILDCRQDYQWLL
ncbi:MAG: type II toxin-antitoxin system RelE/ParE family toxin [Odoribacter sp.]|nr:type II toxin-antitoxin system RelE/ParE family toxin [Odoribacter sp.]